VITRETDYALRAILYLAQQEQGKTVSTAELSDVMGIPYRFLRKIVAKLVGAELIKSKRGKGGGLTLARPGDAITLLDVVMATEPDAVRLNECLSSPESCRRSDSCSLNEVLGTIQRRFLKELSAVNFARLARMERRRG
jgi:Rrf2 family protein